MCPDIVQTTEQLLVATAAAISLQGHAYKPASRRQLTIQTSLTLAEREHRWFNDNVLCNV